MSHARAGTHRYTPATRAQRPVPRGRHRLMDRQRAGIQYLRVASAAVMALMSLAGHYYARPRGMRRSARRI